MNTENTLTIDGVVVPIQGERNVLELVRKAEIDLPTFCYHSELSVYGACRLCMVDLEGRGMVASCATPPEPGMKIRTQTKALRELRKVNLELLLASGNHDCPTCPKSGTCVLQSLAERLGVTDVRFKAPRQVHPVDHSSPSLVRDPNRCVLCGDCVRVCNEIQGIGVLDFCHRGAKISVGPAFHKGLAEVDCVNCGQCAAACPTGALTIKSDIEKVQDVLEDPAKVVVVQMAPAVRAALGESFGLDMDAQTVQGRMVAALRRLGFDKIYDTAFAADLTIMEEAHEFLDRKKKGKNLPLFSSCCPAWVKLAEQDFPELLPHLAIQPTNWKMKVEHLSSCRSPQQMFGSLAKHALPDQLKVSRENLVVVSVMPCTAKKFEAARPEFSVKGNPDVDFVLTTQEVARMIRNSGLDLGKLKPESLDMPFGHKTGAGIIFGNSGGVTEAVLRRVASELDGTEAAKKALTEIRGEDGRREYSIQLSVGEVKGAVVHGLANARALVEDVMAGRCSYDFVEVMACPGGCINGAGQPVSHGAATRQKRTQALRDLDTHLDLHRSQDNHMVQKAYEVHMPSGPGGQEAHALLHTHYQNRKRIQSGTLPLSDTTGKPRIPVSVCIGTGCQLRGAQDLLRKLLLWAETDEKADRFDIRATFCMEACDRGPTIRVNGHTLCHSTFDQVMMLMDEVAEEEPVTQQETCCKG